MKWFGKSQLEMFINYSALTIAAAYARGYDYLSPDGLRNSFWYLKGGGPNDLFHFPTFAHDFFAGSSITPGFLLLVQIPVSLLLLIRPIRRWAGGLLFITTVMTINYCECLSVLTCFVLFFALAIALFPVEKGREQRAFMLCGMAMAWGLSGLHKINFNYLSGLEVRYDLALIARSYSSHLMHSFAGSVVLALVGVLLELTAFNIIFVGTRGAALGFLAIQLFTLGTLISIGGGDSIARFFAGFCFLLEFSWATFPLFIALLAWPLLYAAVSSLLSFIGDTFLQAPLFFVYACAPYLLFIFLLIKRSYETAPIEISNRRIGILGVVTCALFAGVVRIFMLPTPLGWTQYAGFKDRLPHHVVYYRGVKDRPIGNTFSFSGFWDLRKLPAPGDRLVIASLYDYNLENFRRFLCKFYGPVSVFEETLTGVEMMKLSDVPEALGQRFDRLIAGAKPLPCSGLP
jgi:hypothetical protein